MLSGIGIVIFITGFWVIIFGEAAHAAVVKPATINPVTAMDVNNFIFIVEPPFCFGEASSNPPRRLFVFIESLHQLHIIRNPAVVVEGTQWTVVAHIDKEALIWNGFHPVLFGDPFR